MKVFCVSVLMLLLAGLQPVFSQGQSEIKGKVQIRCNDCFNPDHKGPRETYLIQCSETDQLFELELTQDEKKGLKPGKKIRVRGAFKNRGKKGPQFRKRFKLDTITEEASGTEGEEAGAGNEEPVAVNAAPAATELGCLLIFVNTNDYTVPSTRKDTIRNLFFNNSVNVNKAIEQVTYGHYKLKQGNGPSNPGEVTVNLNYNAGDKDIYDIQDDVLAALSGLGYTRNNYDRLFIFAPQGAKKSGSTNWTAYGYYNWDLTVYSYNWSTQYFDGFVHELGHNFGLAHSNKSGSYKDVTCVMGFSHKSSNRTAGYNPVKVMKKGFLSTYSGTNTVLSQDSTLVLSPLAKNRLSASGMRVVQFNGSEFYVAYRRTYSTYARLWDSNDHNKVIVYERTDANYAGSEHKARLSPGGSYTAGDVVISFDKRSSDNDSATVSFDLNDGNTRPTASSQSVELLQNSAINITLSASDADGNPLTYTVDSSTANGTLSGSGPNLLYTPNAGYTGSDSFTFSVNDGKISSRFATVSINVFAGPNTVPVVNAGTDQTLILGGNVTAGLYFGTASGNINTTAANPKSQIITNVAAKTEDNIAGNTTEIFTGYIYDADGSISFTENIDDKARIWIDGNLVINNDSWSTRTSTANLNLSPGWHSIEIRISNGSGGSGPASGIGIGFDPNGGTAWQTLSDPGDGSLLRAEVLSAVASLNGTASDADNDPLTTTWSLVSGPASVIFANPAAVDTNATFTAAGTYTLRLTADDGRDQVTDNVVITVNDPSSNSAPVADAQNISLDENTSKTVTLTATDADGDSLTYSLVSQPANGFLSGSAPNLTYTPNADFSGTDSFTFKANDGTDDSNTATVTITVNEVIPPNSAPIAANQNISLDENSSKAVTLTATDADGDSLTYSLVSQPANGFLSGSAPNLTYTPNADFSGTDSFTFKANDGTDDSNTATVTITVNEVQDLREPDNPTDLSAGVNWERFHGSYDALPNFDILMAAAIGKTATFSLGLGEPADYYAYRYTGYINVPQDGIYTFFTNSDDGSKLYIGSDEVVNNDGLHGARETSGNIGLKAGKHAVTVTFFEKTGGNVLSVSWQGPGLSKQTIPASALESETGNRAPVADNQSVSTDQNTPAAVTLTASDADGDTLSFTVVNQPANGTLSGNAPNLTYSPNTGFTGADSFTFKANDGLVDSDVATVNITVNAPTVSSLVSTVSATGRIAWFTFDTDTSDTDGNLNLALTGAEVGNADARFGTGSFRAAAAGQYGRVADHSLLNSGGPWSARTTAVWFKLDTVNGRQVIIEEGGSTRGFNIYADNGNLYVGGWDQAIDGDDVDTWSGTWHNLGTVSAGQWYHVAYVLDASANPALLSNTGFTAYLNGVEAASGNGMQIHSHTDDFGIGALAGGTRYHDSATTGNDTFAGRVDDLAIWNRALDAAEIAKLADVEITQEVVIAESGEVTVEQTDSSTWFTVNLEHSFTDPVVILGPATIAGAQPVAPRVRNVTANSFQFQIDEWEYLDGYHATEIISWLVVEAGDHTLPDGSRISAGTNNTGTGFSAVSWDAFSSAPVVLSQVVTTNDATAVTTRQRSVTASGFEVSLEVEEAAGTTHGNETVAWVAVSSGSGVLGEAGKTSDSVTHNWHSASFVGTKASTPLILANMQTADGGDAATLRIRNVSVSGFEVQVQEEESNDTELNHTTEVVGYLVMTPGLITNVVPLGSGSEPAEVTKAAAGAETKLLSEKSSPNSAGRNKNRSGSGGLSGESSDGSGAVNENYITALVVTVDGNYKFHFYPGETFDYYSVKDSEYIVTYSNSAEIMKLIKILFNEEDIIDIKFE